MCSPQQQDHRRDFVIGASSGELGALDGSQHAGAGGSSTAGGGAHHRASRYVTGADAAAADFQPPYFPPPYNVPQPPGPGAAALGVDFAPHPHHHHALAPGNDPYSRLAAAAGSHYAAPYHHHAQSQQYVAERHQLFAGIDPQSSLQRGFVATGTTTTRYIFMLPPPRWRTLCESGVRPPLGHKRRVLQLRLYNIITLITTSGQRILTKGRIAVLSTLAAANGFILP